MNTNDIKNDFESKKNKELIYSLIIDAVGMGSYLIPALAEVSDVVIAPVSALLVYAIYKTPIGAITDFVEELLPGTDIIPTASIIWYYKYQINKDKSFQSFIEARQDENKTIN